MKKITSLLLLVVVSILLVACGKVGEGNNGGTKIINLTYADWGDEEFNQAMIDAFMKEYPHIKVKIDPVGGTGAEFTGNLIAQAQGDFLPDVFAIDNVPTVIKEGLTLDVAQYWDADEDAKLVYSGIAETGVYNGKRYAVPSFQFFKGIFINKTIFKDPEKGLTPVEGKYRLDEEGLPLKDWTYSEMVEIAKAITNYTVNDKSTFVSGLGLWYGAADFQQIWPFMDDPNVGYDTWDGTKFNYTSDAWKDAMRAKVDLMDNVKYPGVTSNFPADDTEFLAELGWMIATGYHAMQIDGTWNFGAVTQALENNQELGFWPYPGGEGGQKVPTILDYQCVSSQTRHPEEAYLLAKWMTYGKQGWLTRLDLLQKRRDEEIAKGDPISHLIMFPVADYPEVWEKVDQFLHDKDGNIYIDGLQDILDNIENAQPDLDKWLAGYKDFWTWVHDEEDNPYRWVNLLEQGPTAVDTFAAEWNKKINEVVQEALQNLGK